MEEANGQGELLYKPDEGKGFQPSKPACNDFAGARSRAEAEREGGREGGKEKERRKSARAAKERERRTNS